MSYDWSQLRDLGEERASSDVRNMLDVMVGEKVREEVDERKREEEEEMVAAREVRDREDKERKREEEQRQEERKKEEEERKNEEEERKKEDEANRKKQKRETGAKKKQSKHFNDMTCIVILNFREKMYILPCGVLQERKLLPIQTW